MIKHIFLMILGVSALHANASWLAPEYIRNDLLPVKASEANMTETEFKQIIQSLQTFYAPRVAQLGGRLSMTGDWKSETLNAGARQGMGAWQVQITGGLARRPELTQDAFTLILCHELGHHLGGFAFAAAQTPFEKPWAANEGQADYFSTQVCAKEIWANDLEKNAQAREKASAKALKQCDSVWTQAEDLNLCARILTAVESMTATMSALAKKPLPDFETPDSSKVEKTSDKHPAIQCRMDTTTQGALCSALPNKSIIPGKTSPGGVFGLEAEKEAATFSCTQFSGFSIGLRPACWFRARM